MRSFNSVAVTQYRVLNSAVKQVISLCLHQPCSIALNQTAAWTQVQSFCILSPLCLHFIFNYIITQMLTGRLAAVVCLTARATAADRCNAGYSSGTTENYINLRKAL